MATATYTPMEAMILHKEILQALPGDVGPYTALRVALEVPMLLALPHGQLWELVCGPGHHEGSLSIRDVARFALEEWPSWCDSWPEDIDVQLDMHLQREED